MSNAKNKSFIDRNIQKNRIKEKISIKKDLKKYETLITAENLWSYMWHKCWLAFIIVFIGAVLFVYLGGLQDEILRQVKVAVSFLVVVITPTTDAYFNYMKLRRILERRKLNR